MGKFKGIFSTLAGLVLGLTPVSTVAGVGEGQELYDAYCQVCHGGLGEGQTMGKPLTDAMANRLGDDELIAVITNGRSGTGMAAWGSSFSETEIYDIASYVRVLQGKPGLDPGHDEAGPGDDPAVLAGESLFNNEGGCIACHSYDDRGGSVGPSLDGVGRRLSGDGLLQALANPSAGIASGYEAKEIIRNDGTVIRGRYRNDSELAVQIQSGDGSRWVTYFKDRVRSARDLEKSLMPEVFATLGADEQAHLLAFLNSL